MSDQPEALRMANSLAAHSLSRHGQTQAARLLREQHAEIQRLRAENEALQKAYWKMRNSAAGFSNYCDDNASTRRCERDYTEGEALYRAAIKAVEEVK